MGRLFGTDGVRGIANQELTPDLAFKLGYAGAVVLTTDMKYRPTVLLGWDTRLSCGMLESALTAGICAAGADVFLCGVLPTPAVAYLTKKYRCDAGAMISASHNSFEYNGIKFFSSNGFKLPDQVEDEIEAIVNDFPHYSQNRPTGYQVGQKIIKSDAQHDYAEHLKRRMSVDLSGLKVALDCANGSASPIAPTLFKDLGAQVFVTGNHPDGRNINAHCGSTDMSNLRDLIRREGCDLGLAFDGDADRLLAMDEFGDLIDGDKILAIIGLHLQSLGQLQNNTIVATIMSNLGLDTMAKEAGLHLVKTKVGDRYVLEEMIKCGYSLGGEQSGHVIFLEHSSTGDGILTALALLRVLISQKKQMSQLGQVFTLFPQVLLATKVLEEQKNLILADDELGKITAKYQKVLQDKGRILIRASGTEPVIRVMLEGENLEQIQEMANAIIGFIEEKYHPIIQEEKEGA